MGKGALEAAAQESNAQETRSVKLGSDFGKFLIQDFWAWDDEPHLATVSKKEKLMFITLGQTISNISENHLYIELGESSKHTMLRITCIVFYRINHLVFFLFHLSVLFYFYFWFLRSSVTM